MYPNQDHVIELAAAPAGALLEAFACVAGLVQRRGPKPILGNVLIEKQGGCLSLTATDGESRLTANSALGGLCTSGATTVDIQTLLALLRLMEPTKQVSLRLDGNWLRVASTRLSYRLCTMDAEKFPKMEIAPDEGGEVVTMTQGALKAMLAKSLNCMAVKDIRGFLCGALLEVSGGEIAVVASTGNSMLVSSQVLNGAGGAHRETIPRKTVVELMRLLSDSADPIEMRFGKGQVCFKWGRSQLVTPTVTGFPNWQRVLPAPDAARCVVKLNREALLQALQACASVVASESTPIVILDIACNAITLRSQSGSEECEIVVDTLSVEGDGLQYGCNIELLRDGVLSLTGPTLVMGLRDASSAVKITTTEDAVSQYVLMPIRTKAAHGGARVGLIRCPS